MAQSLAKVLECKLCRLQQDKARFTGSQEVVAEVNEWQRSPQYLDVGGVAFHVSREALQRGGTHTLSALCSGDFPSEADAHGSIFIDRDSTWFALVLQHLRDDTTFVPATQAGRKAALREARFYSVPGLCARMGQRPQVVVAGGLPFHGCNGIGAVDIYDVWARRWVTHYPAALQNRSRAQYVLVGHTMYLAVCGPMDRPLWTLLSYSLVSHACEQLATLHEIEGGYVYELLHHDGKLVFVTLTWPKQMTIWTLELQTMSLSGHACTHVVSAFGCPVNVGQSPAAFCILRGALVMIGGEDVECLPVPAIHRYDFGARRWSLMRQMGSTELHYSAVVWEGKLVVAGSHTSELYDPTTQQWGPMPRLPLRRMWTRLVAGGPAEQELFLVGGYDLDQRAPSAEVHRFNAASQAWELCSKLPFNRHFPQG